MTKNEMRKRDNKRRYEDGWIVPMQKTESYMRATKVKKLFREWLKENMHRFKYKPYPKNSVCNEYYFEGISKNITLVMNYRIPEAMVYHCKDCCDHDVIQYIGYEKHDPQKGYYDFDRLDDKYEYFPTQEALYIHDVFEYIITYVNEKFVEGNQIYINKSECYSSSTIAPKADYDKLKENFYGGGFCLSLSCASNDKDEPIMRVYDLFEEVCTDTYMVRV